MNYQKEALEQNLSCCNASQHFRTRQSIIILTIFVSTLFVNVTKIICIRSSPNWICLGHKAIITIWIGVPYVGQ